jgi:hypothetical protein
LIEVLIDFYDEGKWFNIIKGLLFAVFSLWILGGKV